MGIRAGGHEQAWLMDSVVGKEGDQNGGHEQALVGKKKIVDSDE